MNDKVLKKEFPITYYQVDYNSTMKPSVLLNFFQDLAIESADISGFGYSVISQKNLCWFLIKYHIEFKKYPRGIKKLDIQTEPRGIDRLMAMRDFGVYVDGDCIARATSSWLLADMETRSIVSVNESLPMMWKYEKREDDLKFEKIRIPEKFNFIKEFEVRYDDLDINKHVNNPNYIIWALEAVPFEFISTHNLKTIDMYFKKEALYGETIVSNCSLDNENLSSIHSLINKQTGDELCLVSIKYF